MEGKKRVANFTTSEEELLPCIVTRNADVLESKKTDATSNSMKNQTWAVVEKEYNAASGGVFRSWIVLKKKYENLKKSTRRSCPTTKSWLAEQVAALTKSWKERQWTYKLKKY